VAQLESLLGLDFAARARPPSVDFSTSTVQNSTLDAEVGRAPRMHSEVGELGTAADGEPDQPPDLPAQDNDRGEEQRPD
jgi:hypothetical protein